MNNATTTEIETMTETMYRTYRAIFENGRVEFRADSLKEARKLTGTMTDAMGEVTTMALFAGWSRRESLAKKGLCVDVDGTFTELDY
jgi:hypothetical protein